jgi:hypothetical protein
VEIAVADSSEVESAFEHENAGVAKENAADSTLAFSAYTVQTCAFCPSWRISTEMCNTTLSGRTTQPFSHVLNWSQAEGQFAIGRPGEMTRMTTINEGRRLDCYGACPVFRAI